MLLALCVMTLTGCASRAKDPPLNVLKAAEGTPMATIRNSASWGWSTYVYRVDDKPVKYKRVLLDHGYSQRVQVPAGVHKLDVKVDSQHVDYHWSFGFKFEPGHVYRLAPAGAFDQRVRVTDETAGTSKVMGPKQLP